MILAFRVLRAETDKLNGSLVLLLAVSPPLMLMVLKVAVILSGNGPDTWMQAGMSGVAIWAYFLMPMTITALTALTAGLEHQNAGWTWTLAQPAPKWLVFAMKALVCVVLIAFISAGVGMAIVAGGLIASAVAPDQALTGVPPINLITQKLAGMLGAGFLMLAIQFTVAHAFRAFAIPIIVGITGTFVAVVATSSRYGLYFPWLLPVNIMATDRANIDQALITGLIGGGAVFAAACVWLARRDWR